LQKQKIRYCRIFIKKGADVNKVNTLYISKYHIYKDKSPPGKTALMYACKQKELGHLTDQKVVEEVDKLNLDIVTKLIDNFADVNVKHYIKLNLEGTALTEALSNEKINTSVVYYLLNIQNIDVNINSYSYGTPIMQACKKQNLDIVNALLEKPNIDLNLQDNLKKTALMYACENKNLDIVKALLKKPNINLNLKDNDAKSFNNYIEIFLPDLYNELHPSTKMQNVTL